MVVPNAPYKWKSPIAHAPYSVTHPQNVLWILFGSDFFGVMRSYRQLFVSKLSWSLQKKLLIVWIVFFLSNSNILLGTNKKKNWRLLAWRQNIYFENGVNNHFLIESLPEYFWSRHQVQITDVISMTMILHGVGCRTFRPNSRVQDLEDVIQMNRTSRHKIKLSRYHVNPKSVHEEGEEMLLQDTTFIKVILPFTLCMKDL